MSDEEMERLKAQGIYKNPNKVYSIQLTGRELHNLIDLLQRRAVSADGYMDVRDAVMFAEQLWEQMVKQGL